MHAKGFSLLELLVVLVILGLLGALGFITLRESINRGQVREVATRLAADLTQARSSAQRYSRPSQLEVASNGKSYTLTLRQGAPDQTIVTYTVPPEITLGAVGSTPTQITYTAPLGEITSNSAAAFAAEIKSNRTTYSKVVRAIGVTGKVVLQ
jgi:type II secretion system protein H